MTTAHPRSRSGALTREQIVGAAVEILDADGERGLTFRALALRLETGHGAIQWHVANKTELLMAATVTTLTQAATATTAGTPPRDAIRAIALDMFSAIDAHSWLGAQLFAVPWHPAMVQLWEQIGEQLEELGVPSDSLFTAVSILVNYIVGVGSQNAVNTHTLAAGRSRDSFLGSVADHWESPDPAEGSLISRLATQLRTHDDRDEFLAGVDIILTGLTAPRTA